MVRSSARRRAHLARDHGLRPRFLHVDADIRIVLVVAKLDVVARPLVADEIGLPVQRLGQRVGQQVLDVGDLGDHLPLVRLERRPSSESTSARGCAASWPCRHTAARPWRRKTCTRRAGRAVAPAAGRAAGSSRASCVNCRKMPFTATQSIAGAPWSPRPKAPTLVRGDPACAGRRRHPGHAPPAARRPVRRHPGPAARRAGVRRPGHRPRRGGDRRRASRAPRQDAERAR